MIKHLFIIALAATLGTGAHANGLTLATGKQGGGYDRAAQAMAKRLEQRGVQVAVANQNGSDEITLAMCTGRADIGIAQIDAVDARLNEGCNLKPIGTYGDEVAVILFPESSRLGSLNDLDADSKVLIDTIGSGSELFWRTIVRIEQSEKGNNSSWAQATAVNDDIALAQTLADFGDIDAVVMVRTPQSPDIATLLSRGWSLGKLYDKDVDDYLFNGQPLYDPTRVKLSVNNKTRKGKGYTVRSFFLATPEITADRATFSILAGAAR